MIDYRYSQSEFDTLLSQFRSAIDSGEYTEKIPYETWRKLKKLAGPFVIEYESSFVRIKSCFICIDGTETWDTVYSAKTYDWGFGRFFYDYVIKKEWNKDMTLNSANNVTFTCDKADINRSVWDQLTDISVSTKVDTGSTAYATALETKADYMGYYDSDSATACPNYGTTTDHAIKVSGTPLTTNTIELTGIPSLDHFGYHDINGTWDSVASKRDVDDKIAELRRELEKKVDKAEKTECVKENDTMMKGINFDFGPCGNTVRLSMYGMAIQNISGEWVSYNPDSREIINVDVFNMADGGKYMYKMPVAIADVKEGDIVIHNRVPMFVTAINENGTFEVTDVRAGETKNIIPTRSPFGFNFMTKIVSLFNGLMTPDKSNPFGNMWMFAMMSGDKNFDMKDMLMISMMTGNNDFVGNMNPMMLMFMMDDKNEKNDWLMPLMLMNSGMMNQPHTCQHAKPAVEAGQI